MGWTSILTSLLVIMKFIATELPGFLEEWSKVKKDTKYKTNKERFREAHKRYKKTLSLEDLNEITK